MDWSAKSTWQHDKRLAPRHTYAQTGFQSYRLIKAIVLRYRYNTVITCLLQQSNALHIVFKVNWYQSDFFLFFSFSLWWNLHSMTDCSCVGWFLTAGRVTVWVRAWSKDTASPLWGDSLQLGGESTASCSDLAVMAALSSPPWWCQYCGSAQRLFRLIRPILGWPFLQWTHNVSIRNEG